MRYYTDPLDDNDEPLYQEDFNVSSKRQENPTQLIRVNYKRGVCFCYLIPLTLIFLLGFVIGYVLHSNP